MKKVGSLLLAVLMVLSLAACGKTPAEPTQTPSTQPSTETPTTEATEPAPAYAIDTLTVGTTAAIETAVFGEYNFDMLASGVSELPLVYQDTKGEYHPLLATYATEDAATWTYTIQDGMTWSDGAPVTAEDILFTLQYDQANGSANFEAQTGEDGKVTEAKYTGYSLSDDKMSISLTLASPNVRELSNMTSFRVMPKHIYEGKDTVSEAEGRITCGPYVLESFNKEAGTITFAVNEYYPQKPNVEKIVYQLFGNEDTMYLALQQGDIDMVWAYSTGVAGTYQDVLSTDTNVSLVNVAAANAPAVLAFNNAKGLFSDENLRQAVSYALNYEEFKTYFGSAYAEIPNRGFVPSTTVGYTDTEKLTTDTAKADEYMKAAGYTEKNADGFYVNADGAAADGQRRKGDPCGLRRNDQDPAGGLWNSGESGRRRQGCLQCQNQQQVLREQYHHGSGNLWLYRRRHGHGQRPWLHLCGRQSRRAGRLPGVRRSLFLHSGRTEGRQDH